MSSIAGTHPFDPSDCKACLVMDQPRQRLVLHGEKDQSEDEGSPALSSSDCSTGESPGPSSPLRPPCAVSGPPSIDPVKRAAGTLLADNVISFETFVEAFGTRPDQTVSELYGEAYGNAVVSG